MKIPIRQFTLVRGLFAFVLFLAFSGVGILLACQVPVFRYALERWPSDPYELICVPAQGGLNPKEEAALELLRQAAEDIDFPANITVELDADGENNSSSARFDLFYPRKMRGVSAKPIWSGEATEQNANKIVQSPVRKELIKRILTGESAIWLLVESGDPKKDEAAEKALIEYAQKVTGKLELPEGVIGKSDTEAQKQMRPGDEENILRSDVPLKIGFSVLRISRLDTDEQVFLPMLLNLEDDLGEYANEAMAFPVFGRGRILEPLIGLGISYDNVIAHSGYLTGACSCEVKDQNPGIDLLMSMDWDAAMEGSQVIIDKMLPPLEGTAALTQAHKGSHSSKATQEGEAVVKQNEGENEGEQSENPAEVVVADDQRGGLPISPMILILAVVVIVIGAGTVMIKKNAD